MRILIVGAGPAGLTLAACLLRRGIRPTLIERAPAPRSAGYAVDLHANGLDVAERLGLAASLKAAAMQLGDAVYRDRSGRELYRFGYDRMVRAADGKFIVIMRDALVSVLTSHVGDRVAPRYGTTIRAMEMRDGHVQVSFNDGSNERFDLVVGADGIHSGVRELAMGPEEDFVRHLGYGAAAWRMPWAEPLDAAFVTHIDVDRYAALYMPRRGEIASLFCWRGSTADMVRSCASASAVQSVFTGWNDTISRVIDATIDWSDVYADDVSQIVMPRWSSGRVVLIGDAAHCMTLISGQGTSMAMAGAYVLAEEIARAPLATALERYESRLRPTVDRLQTAARRNARRFLPASQLGLRVRSILLPILLSSALIRRTARSVLAASVIDASEPD